MDNNGTPYCSLNIDIAQLFDLCCKIKRVKGVNWFNNKEEKIIKS